jgi:hypothetical protein
MANITWEESRKLRTQSIVNVVSSLLENVKADEVIKE